MIREWRFLRSLSVKHWRHILRNLSSAEINLMLVWLGLAIAASLFLASYDFWVLKAPAPDSGGSYSEAVVGEPHYLNPLLASSNEADRDLTTLIFSGLVKHNEQGEIVPDLAESYKVSNDGKTYEFILKPNLLWPDGEPFTSDDVVFTVNLIKDPKYQSPLKNNWQGVKAEKVDERKVVIRLPVEYTPFLENATVGILPKHLWSQVQPQNFLLTQLNIKPVGLGQYQVRKITKNAAGSIRSLELSPNPNYPEKANIQRLIVRFYENQEDVINAYRRRQIDGFALSSAREMDDLKPSLNLYRLKLPRYFAVFFNQDKSPALKEANVRQALAYAADRDGIVREILKSEAQTQYGPFPHGLLSIKEPDQKYEFNLEKAENVLEKNKWKRSEESGLREKKLSGDKNPSPLELTLTTTDWPELTQVASILKRDWEKIGVRVNLDVVPVAAVQSQIIRPREYQALLFGEVLGLNPDPFSFWHTTQRKDPGLNLALYSDKRVDGLLETARQNATADERVVKYERFQNILMDDAPAVFIYSPNYIYAVSNKVKGIAAEAVNTPSQRFENINKWYIETKRVRK
mgnify:CR=1 FL=1